MEASFDLLAASLRADRGDLRGYVEGLAAKLGGAFPDHVRVERSGLFGRKPVRRLVVQLGDERYELDHDGGDVACRRGSVVRGITLKNEELDLDAWIDELAGRLSDEAQRSERARLALERLLGG